MTLEIREIRGDAEARATKDWPARIPSRVLAHPA